MISEESCDTEAWSNDAEKSALPHRKKTYFNVYIYIYIYIYIKKTKVILNCNISQNYRFFFSVFLIK